MSNDDPFHILGERIPAPQLGEEVQNSSPMGDLQERLQSLINASDVVLFMKGNPQFPQCGFSANAIGILNEMGKSFKTFDILSDPEVRQGLKEHSNWPTYPQLYVKGKLMGGNDILMEMYQQGELQKMFKNL